MQTAHMTSKGKSRLSVEIGCRISTISITEVNLLYCSPKWLIPCVINSQSFVAGRRKPRFWVLTDDAIARDGQCYRRAFVNME